MRMFSSSPIHFACEERPLLSAGVAHGSNAVTRHSFTCAPFVVVLERPVASTSLPAIDAYVKMGFRDRPRSGAMI